MGEVFIGTSGWSYKSWVNTFYPPKLPVSRHFDHYATFFRTVEINLTFYRLPTPTLVAGWLRKAPPDFRYAVKGSRFITHLKKLRQLDGALDLFFERIEPLHKKVVCILWQLPPMLQYDPLRLADFLQMLPRNYRHAVEFRHPSWLRSDIFDLLRCKEAAYVSVSSRAMPMDLTVTSNLVYIRFHGLEGGFSHDYSREELTPWASHIARQQREGRTVLAYFNNDGNARAPGNALTLGEMVR
jgi:uncharacterized protein YecE (DUF72 family)